MKKILFALTLLFTAVVFAVTGEGLQATGYGSTYRAAVTEALVSALEMKSGVTMTSSERAEFAAASHAVISSEGDRDHMAIDDSVKKSVSTSIDGKISGYEVVDETYDPATKKYRVEVIVHFPARYVVGLDPENRRRMAVVDFRPYGDTFSWYGREASSVEWVKSLSDKLNVRLTKTRRFSMLERKFVAEINDEMLNLKDENIAPGEVARRCQKLMTDYLVVGEVRFYPVAAPAVNPYTGKVMPRASQLFAEVTYRVVLAPTGQLKFTDIVKVNAASVSAGSIGEFTSQTTDLVAALITDGIMANYKLRDEATDGTEAAEISVDTMNETPAPEIVIPAQPTTIRGNGTGGVVTPF